MRVLVTGGAGYLGATATRALLEAGHDVRVLDNLLHGQQAVADALSEAGADVLIGDVRDARDRARALADVDAVVHLAAIVGDPACRELPELSDAVNEAASRALVRDAAASRVARFVFASTCSNYGVVEDGAVVDETSELRPVSRYARQKVAIERYLTEELETASMDVACLRFATLFGVAERMRFDLLVNEFARDLWHDRVVGIHGLRTWRPYVHVRDAARVIVAALDRPSRDRTPLVLNVGADQANFRKMEIAELIADIVGRGTIEPVASGDDPRSYRVSFARLAERLGITPEWSVERGVQDLVALLDAGRIADPFDRAYVNA
jgi:nucleoside-diphosphate-sugar epimerase